MATADLEQAGAESRVPAESRREPEVNKLFRMVMKHEGSDLHLKGVIRTMEAPPISAEGMERLLFPIMSEHHRKILEDTGGADFAHIVGNDEQRFRVNIFYQRGRLSLVSRRVNNDIPTFEKLHLPEVLAKLSTFDQGMIILAGVTGSGKSTTIASMLDFINERERVHILTIEDPIEYTFTDKKAVINQREVGIDVKDWAIALKHAVREDPDIILVGEMRDRETFEAGINAAETGHLVFSTIHASTPPSTVGRIRDLFPADMHPAMRQALAFDLKQFVCHTLPPS